MLEQNTPRIVERSPNIGPVDTRFIFHARLLRYRPKHRQSAFARRGTTESDHRGLPTRCIFRDGISEIVLRSPRLASVVSFQSQRRRIQRLMCGLPQPKRRNNLLDCPLFKTCAHASSQDDSRDPLPIHSAVHCSRDHFFFSLNLWPGSRSSKKDGT